MVRQYVIVSIPQGLHARPAVDFVQLMDGFASEVIIARPDDPLGADAKDLLEVLGLDLDFGDRVLVEASGPDERESLEAAVAFIGGRG